LGVEAMKFIIVGPGFEYKCGAEHDFFPADLIPGAIAPD